MGGGTNHREGEARRELKLVQRVAASVRTTDDAALESELALHLLHLKRHPPRGVRNWNAYLKTALHNKALNWLRDHQKTSEELASLDAPLPGTPDREAGPVTLLDLLRGAEPDVEFLVAIGRLLEECDAWLCAVWRALLQTDGNLTQAAKRLRVHRHTIRAAARRIVELLRRHGFGLRR